ncbi:aldo/keto reductase [Kurthia massiliensis]|uniref:aldo/keto reductase n=1 Tax=Kurthia massiliensis TaxID=1033739 RepID=UPI000288C7F8|nr:aldo/keto reductase [Kurthia massiliensis]
MSVETKTLADGHKIPVIGFGTVFMKGEAAAEGVASAIQHGYRLIDTAIRYDNEGAVGEGIRRSNVPREELFVTSKLRAQYYDRKVGYEMIEESLFRMGLDYLDLYLLHWPNPKQDKYVEAWQTLIEAQKEGLVRSIGVCNFMPEHLNRLEEETGVLPVVNQIELHPYFSQEEMRAYNESKQIVTESWSPLSRGRTVIYDETLQKIAAHKNKTIGQIILRWHYQIGAVAIPKAASEKHQLENLAIFDFSLTDEEMALINALTQDNGRIDNQDPREYEEF